MHHWAHKSAENALRLAVFIELDGADFYDFLLIARSMPPASCLDVVDNVVQNTNMLKACISCMECAERAVTLIAIEYFLLHLLKFLLRKNALCL